MNVFRNDSGGNVIFYNKPAGDILGRQFDDTDPDADFCAHERIGESFNARRITAYDSIERVETGLRYDVD